MALEDGQVSDIRMEGSGGRVCVCVGGGLDVSACHANSSRDRAAAFSEASLAPALAPVSLWCTGAGVLLHMAHLNLLPTRSTPRFCCICCSPDMADAYLGPCTGYTTCGSVAGDSEDLDFDLDFQHHAASAGGGQQASWQTAQPQQPFPKPWQELLLPADAAAAPAAAAVPDGVEMEERASCVLSGSAQQVAEVSHGQGACPQCRFKAWGDLCVAVHKYWQGVVGKGRAG